MCDRLTRVTPPASFQKYIRCQRGSQSETHLTATLAVIETVPYLKPCEVVELSKRESPGETRSSNCYQHTHTLLALPFTATQASKCTLFFIWKICVERRAKNDQHSAPNEPEKTNLSDSRALEKNHQSSKKCQGLKTDNESWPTSTNQRTQDSVTCSP